MDNKKAIALVLIVIAVCCGVWFLIELYMANEEDEVYADISDRFITVTSTESRQEDSTPGQAAPGPEFVEPNFEELLEQNPETIGWLYIPGTEISYPVTQTTNNSKYLSRDFNGDKSSAGCVFMESQNNVDPLDKNTVLFGHHIRGRSIMFGPLISYMEQEFFEEHRIIQFDTIAKKYGWWEVFAVLHINYKTDEFKYLQLGFDDDDSFMDWVSLAKSESLYDTGVEVAAEDQVLVLSTCERTGFGRNGRFIVLAKQTVG